MIRILFTFVVFLVSALGYVTIENPQSSNLSTKVDFHDTKDISNLLRSKGFNRVEKIN